MPQTPDPRETLRFGDFELDLNAYELSRKGRRVRLGRQPMDLLILLLERRPQLVSRTDIVDRLWGKDVFVDVETGVNTAISKVRQALRDSPDTPAFVERVPGRGYRFVAAVDVTSGSQASGSTAAASEVAPLREQTVEVPTDLHHDLVVPAMVGDPFSAPTARADPVRTLGTRTFNRARVAIGLMAVAAALGFASWMRLRGGGPAAAVTLAVLPFTNLGTDPEREGLAAGLTDETTASLAQIDPEHVSVKGRTLRYKNTTKSVAELGRELSVDYLVEASIRPDTGGVHVTVTLLRMRDQHVWSNVYAREATKLLGLPKDISTDIARQIHGSSSAERVRDIEQRQTRSNDALYAFFKARSLENGRNPHATASAIEEFKHALALDPDYALAWCGLGGTYAASTVNSDANPHEVADLARQAAAAAIRINPNLEEAWKLDGYVKWLLDWNWTAAETSFRRAIDLDPSDGLAFRALGHALSQSGRHAEAAAAMARTRELEPLDPMSHALSSQVAFQAHDYSAAIGFANRAIQMRPELWIGYMQLAQAHVSLGNTAVALEMLTEAARRSQQNSKAISLRGYVLAKAGQNNEAREVLKTLEEWSRDRNRYVPPYAVALVYLGFDEKDEVFAWLDKAYQARDVHLIYLPVDAKWDPYRTDRRFADLLARCGFTASTPTAAARTKPSP